MSAIKSNTPEDVSQKILEGLMMEFRKPASHKKTTVEE